MRGLRTISIKYDWDEFKEILFAHRTYSNERTHCLLFVVCHSFAVDVCDYSLENVLKCQENTQNSNRIALLLMKMKNAQQILLLVEVSKSSRLREIGANQQRKSLMVAPDKNSRKLRCRCWMNAMIFLFFHDPHLMGKGTTIKFWWNVVVT